MKNKTHNTLLVVSYENRAYAAALFANSPMSAADLLNSCETFVMPDEIASEYLVCCNLISHLSASQMKSCVDLSETCKDFVADVLFYDVQFPSALFTSPSINIIPEHSEFVFKLLRTAQDEIHPKI